MLRIYFTFLFLLKMLLPLTGQNISGQVRTAGGQGIVEAAVMVTGPSGTLSGFTDNNGSYSFSGLTAGQLYSVCITQNANPLNGVTTFDMNLLINKVVLQLPPLLTSPYQIIAGQTDDVYEMPDIGDALRIRKVIFGELTDFPAPSWRFIPADYVFPNPANPFVPPFPQGCKTLTINGNVSGVDFIGVKTADLNGDASPF